MVFTGRWRDYQQRVLDEFDTHITDARLHVVAAPGSGKTVLGLEIMRRLSRPTLIFSPTRAIRDQWSSRLVPLFLPAPPTRDEISYDLATPQMMTVSTYQALHGLWTNDDDRLESLTKTLRSDGPVTIILDEAHHLRREWWNALQAFVRALPDAHVIALTATPPYDAPHSEWLRYDEMCGPIDLEIGVPELVRNGDLCPHQDHVVFSAPTAETLELLHHRRVGIARIFSSLKSDQALLDALVRHPWIAAPRENAEQILATPELLSAILVLLAASGRKAPRAPMALLGIGRRELPLPSAFWLEVLLNGLLFRTPRTFVIDKSLEKRLRAALHEHGLIEGGRVRLTESRTMFTLMAGNLAKLASIVDIAREEVANLGDGLRMVVLSDHVRAGDLPRSAEQDYRPAKLGVVPIFETLRRAAIEGQAIGVLTGTLVIIARTAQAALSDLCARRGLRATEISLTPLPGCPDHLKVTGSGEAARHIVELVTALFTAGHLRMLVGTQALLGEGWDAPALNSLILASNSAAFMASNQMRGRAIRIDPERPDKVANIWHLATFDPAINTPLAETRDTLNWGDLADGEEIRSDIDLLNRRFRAFEGISNGMSRRIESGLDRLGIDLSDPSGVNRRSFRRGRDRAAVADIWRRSLGDASPRAHVREIASPNYGPIFLSWNATLQWLVVSAIMAGIFAAADEIRRLDDWTGQGEAVQWIAAAVALAAVPKLLKALWLFLRNGSLERNLWQVGSVVLDSLQYSGGISGAEMAGIRMEILRNPFGRYDMVLQGASRATERMVMTCLAEILGPVGNPRYLLVRRSWLGLWKRTDYHAVPTTIGRREEWANFFHHKWMARVGYSKLVPTRTPKGRRALLRARARSFAAGFQRVVDRRSIWL